MLVSTPRALGVGYFGSADTKHILSSLRCAHGGDGGPSDRRHGEQSLADNHGGITVTTGGASSALALHAIGEKGDDFECPFVFLHGMLGSSNNFR